MEQRCSEEVPPPTVGVMEGVIESESRTRRESVSDDWVSSGVFSIISNPAPSSCPMLDLICNPN